ncbi:nucleotidyltransferase domain-containing protein [Deinococcus yavapaiensis]|nr:hypothetical protein [Deinococcus yavapaiensis]
MLDFEAIRDDLTRALGSYLDRGRTDGVFHVALGGPGSVPDLADLDVPEVHLDLLPSDLAQPQAAALQALGYAASGERTWTHRGGWRLVVCEHDSAWRIRQAALRQLLMQDEQAAIEYRASFGQVGREAADEAFEAAATKYLARTAAFQPAEFVARELSDIGLPWMFAGGLALDLHLGTLTRPHEDVDVILPRDRQAEARRYLEARRWRLDACRDGTYRAWTETLEPPHFQVHARRADFTDALLIDFMFSNLSGDTWHYRRDEGVTRLLSEARRFTSSGLPYLAPELVLLFKSGSGNRAARGKDQRDFERVRPELNEEARRWLRNVLEARAPRHPWLDEL